MSAPDFARRRARSVSANRPSRPWDEDPPIGCEFYHEGRAPTAIRFMPHLRPGEAMPAPDAGHRHRTVSPAAGVAVLVAPQWRAIAKQKGCPFGHPMNFWTGHNGLVGIVDAAHGMAFLHLVYRAPQSFIRRARRKIQLSATGLAAFFFAGLAGASLSALGAFGAFAGLSAFSALAGFSALGFFSALTGAGSSAAQ